MYLCLLSDSLLIADHLPVKRGTIQYRLRWVFELDSLAAVDGNAPSQMKMLVFPQTILFQMESLQVREMLGYHRGFVVESSFGRCIIGSRTANHPFPSCLPQEKSSWIEAIRSAKQQKLSRQAVSNSRLSHDFPGLALALGQGEADEEGEGSPMPDWLVDLPDDLDVCIAERNFEQAVKLIQKGEYGNEVPVGSDPEMRPRKH